MRTDTEVLWEFLQQQPLATIATYTAGTTPGPQAAVVAFAQTPALELVFETFAGTRKWHNLCADQRVAFAIGHDPADHRTLQYEGIARLLPASEAEPYVQLFLAKDTPCTEIYLRDPRARLFCVQPTWLRFSDYTASPVRIIEQTFRV